MSSSAQPQRELNIAELLPSLLLLRTFRLARQPAKLILGAFGLVATIAGWRVAAYVFSGDPQAARLAAAFRPWPWHGSPPSAAAHELATRSEWVAQRLGIGGGLSESDWSWLARNPLWDTWELISRPARSLFAGEANLSTLAFLIVAGLWCVLVWSVVGGAISRIAAVQLCREERVSLREAWTFARGKWGDYAWAPALPLLLVALTVLGISLGSWLMRFDLGLLLVALAFPLVLMAGLVMAVVSLGLVLGWPLMWATVSVEGTDHFDGISRAYAYVFQRPLHFVAYSLGATVMGVCSWTLVAGVAAATVSLGVWATSWTVGPERLAAWSAAVPSDVAMIGWPAEAGSQRVPPPAAANASARLPSAPAVPPRLSVPGRLAGSIIGLWVGLVKLLALGFSASYFWTATTAVYLLLRRVTDHTELDEVYLDPHHESYGLPKLATDAAGVPVVADEPLGEPSPSQLNSTALVEPTVDELPRSVEAALTGSTTAREERADNDGG